MFPIASYASEHSGELGKWERVMQTRDLQGGSRVCITVSHSPNSPERSDEAMATRQKKSSVTFMKYFSKIIQPMKENAGVFTSWLIETDLLDTPSHFLPTNQNARLTMNNLSTFVQCHTLIQTQLLTNESACTILIVLYGVKCSMLW